MSKNRLLRGGVSIAYQEWGPSSSPHKIIALHGWLDNSNTFKYLGPYLGGKGFHLVAYDNIGHGHSSYDPSDVMGYSFVSYVFRCREFLDALGWKKCHMLGHSMGANVAMIYAGCHPEMIDKLTLIDGFGPFTKPPETAAVAMRTALEAELKMIDRLANIPNKIYDSLDAAIDARLKNIKTYPGNQSLSREAAINIVSR
jgi:pimeloyl-ACP methyl ester carboxylesterase